MEARSRACDDESQGGALDLSLICPRQIASECLAMAQTREVFEKLGFVAFFDTREDAEAAAAEGDWLSSMLVKLQRRRGLSTRKIDK